MTVPGSSGAGQTRVLKQVRHPVIRERFFNASYSKNDFQRDGGPCEKGVALRVLRDFERE